MRADRTEAGTRPTVRAFLLALGVVSSLLYVGTDVAATLRWDGYSYADQFISELMSIEAPTRPFVVSGFFLYGVLVTALGIGVVLSARAQRRLRIAGWLIVAYATVGYVGLLFFPMHLRGAVPPTTTWTDVMHILATSVIVLLTFAFVGFGADAGGKGFRRYSIATIVLLLVCGVLISFEMPRLRAVQPTPWLGITERVTAYASMLWLLVLGVVLLRRVGAGARFLRWRSA